MRKFRRKIKLSCPRISQLTLSLPQLQLCFRKFSNPLIVTPIKRVPLPTTRQLVAPHTKVCHSQPTHIPYHSPAMSQIELVMHFVEGLPPGQVEDPDLEGKEGDVDNGPYDNDVSNFSTPTINSID